MVTIIELKGASNLYKSEYVCLIEEAEMKIKVEIIKDKDLPRSYMDLMNKQRRKEAGPKEVKDFKKDYWPGATFFFVKDGKGIVAFGGLRDIKVNYLGKTYRILGICNIFSVKKGKGYGKILIHFMINYLKKKGKTGIGFCGKKVTKFYEKSGLKSKKSFTWRFAIKDPKTGKVKFDDEDCDGVYYNGKDNFIKKILSTKSIVYYCLPDVKKPHW